MKGKRIIILLFVVLFFLLVTSGSAWAVCLNLTGINEVTITSDTELCVGTYGMLDVEQNGSIIFGADNINLDCNGTIIFDPIGGAGIGLMINGRDNVTFSGCHMDGYLDGLVINDSTNVTGTLTTFTGIFRYGTYLWGSRDILLTQFDLRGFEPIFPNPDQTGFKLAYTNYTNVTYSNISSIEGVGYGVSMVEQDCNNNVIYENNFTGITANVINLYGSDTVIENNFIGNGLVDGIYISGSNIDVLNNTFFPPFFNCVYTTGATNVTIKQNSIDACLFRAWRSELDTNVTFYNNTVDSAIALETPMSVDLGSEIYIQYNEIVNVPSGTYYIFNITNTNLLNIDNNLLLGGDNALVLNNVNNTTVHDNVIDTLTAYSFTDTTTFAVFNEWAGGLSNGFSGDRMTDGSLLNISLDAGEASNYGLNMDVFTNVTFKNINITDFTNSVSADSNIPLGTFNDSWFNNTTTNTFVHKGSATSVKIVNTTFNKSLANLVFGGNLSVYWLARCNIKSPLGENLAGANCTARDVNGTYKWSYLTDADGNTPFDLILEYWENNTFKYSDGSIWGSNAQKNNHTFNGSKSGGVYNSSQLSFNVTGNTLVLLVLPLVGGTPYIPPTHEGWNVSGGRNVGLDMVKKTSGLYIALIGAIMILGLVAMFAGGGGVNPTFLVAVIVVVPSMFALCMWLLGKTT